METMLKILLFLTQMGVFGGIHVFLHSVEEAYLEQNDPFSTLKTIISRRNSFKN
jgi:hypothetical protein